MKAQSENGLWAGLFPIELSFFFIMRIHVLTAKNEKSRVMLVVSDHVTPVTNLNVM